MKTLYLVRHAKASHGGPYIPDRDRALDPRGRKDASRIGQRLAARGTKVDRLVSSPALRALTTAGLIAGELGCPREDIAIDERLYASSADQVLAIIEAFEDRLECVMVFGHNPEFSDLAARLSNERVNMAPCTVATLHFDAESWADIAMHAAATMTLDEPALS